MPSLARPNRNLSIRTHTIFLRVIRLSPKFLYKSATDNKDSQKMAQTKSLWGLFIGDAMSMPVHWYYNPHDIKCDFGNWLSGFVAPKTRHPSSILSISAVGGTGRNANGGGQTSPVIGAVILHDKLKFWQSKDRSVHYHQGMKAGDSTLNALVAGKVACAMTSLYRDHQNMDDNMYGEVLAAYVKFMTTPGSHEDTYAESFHREFFKDWVKTGSPVMPEKVLEFAEARSRRLSGNVDHNIDGVGALLIPTPVVILCADLSTAETVKHAVRLVSLTHCSNNLSPFIELYASTLHSVLNGASLRDKAREALESLLLGGSGTWKQAKKYTRAAAQYPKGSEDRLRVYQEAVSHFGLACYIKGAVTSMFFLAYEFHDNFESGVLTNANCGGENCHRGAALGALLGAEAGRTGKEIPQRLKSGIHSAQGMIQDVLDTWS